MKILTVSGTRPDYIRLMPTVRKLDKYYDHKLVWAGQNFEECLVGKFFKEFERNPDIVITQKRIFGISYIAHAMIELEKVYQAEKPDCILVLGDTNASLSASYVAKRLNIPLFHLEAGNRCYDTHRVPEELNRYMIDSIADWHLCYTQRSREHLLLEGKRPNRVIVVGNPIVELVKEQRIVGSDCERYVLATIHRKENIEDKDRLLTILEQLNDLDFPVRLSFHPTLKACMKNIHPLNKHKYRDTMRYFNESYPNIKPFEPTNFKEFLTLEQDAYCIVTDSGTVPEEAHLLRVPCVLLRYTTERPELLESNDLVMCSDPEEIPLAIKIAVEEQGNIPIKDYHTKVSHNIVKILMRWNE